MMDDVDKRLRATALWGLEYHSKAIADSATRLNHYIALLITRPEYETMASGEIEDAQKKIEQALVTIRQIKADYYAKPLDLPIVYEKAT